MSHNNRMHRTAKSTARSSLCFSAAGDMRRYKSVGCVNK